MGLDIRLPIGLMFSLLGLMLATYGFLTKDDSEMYMKSLQTNINLWWGIGLLLFGLFMLFPALSRWRKDKKND